MDMTAIFESVFWRRLTGGLLVVILAAGAGCQTFSMTAEEFEAQQRRWMLERTSEPVIIPYYLQTLDAFDRHGCRGGVRRALGVERGCFRDFSYRPGHRQF